uniref:Uncharacterized protein n=1 Tax=Cacopsylla melanoneura TaxID=428564 RepID=A0A8D8SYB7_9HEMI
MNIKLLNQYIGFPCLSITFLLTQLSTISLSSSSSFNSSLSSQIVQYNFPVQSCIRFPFLSITFLSIRVDKYFFIIFVSSEFNVCTCSPSEHFLHRGSCPV